MTKPTWIGIDMAADPMTNYSLSFDTVDVSFESADEKLHYIAFESRACAKQQKILWQAISPADRAKAKNELNRARLHTVKRWKHLRETTPELLA